MLCDTDRWHASYYFLCEWLSLSHGRWLEYSFHFDNSSDYPQQAQSCTVQDLYVKKKYPRLISLNNKVGIQVSLKIHPICPNVFMQAWLLPFDIFSMQSSCFRVKPVTVCFRLLTRRSCRCKMQGWRVKDAWWSDFSFSWCCEHIRFSTNHVSHLCRLRYIQQLCLLVSNFYKGCTENASKPRGQRPMCWWIMGFHRACCCWQALLVGRMSL